MPESNVCATLMWKTWTTGEQYLFLFIVAWLRELLDEMLFPMLDIDAACRRLAGQADAV